MQFKIKNRKGENRVMRSNRINIAETMLVLVTETFPSWGKTLLLCETLALCFSEHEKRSSADTLQHNSGDSQSCLNTIFPFLTPAEAF